MNKFICTKQYRQFEEFCKACHRDRYIGLCYGAAGVGKTESARHYTKWYQIESYRDANGLLNTSVKPRMHMGKLNTILYTPSVLKPPRDMIREIGMPGIDKMLARFPQLYSRIGFIHNFKKLDAAEVRFILQYHLSKLNIDIKDDSFTDQEVMAAIVMSTGGNFGLINRLIKQSLRIMKVNYMTTITKEIVDAARSCLLIGEIN